ncbi:MAG: zinc ribbon domain-containing protein [Thiohalocapsa sp.]|jgi:putative FmdB family regulatory protein
MPVYELYCPDCHTVYNFFSRRVDTETRPRCPRCGRPDLQRQVSLFAISKGRSDAEESSEELPAGLDEERMMRALASMESEIEHLDESDPKQAARVMRRLFDASGMKVGGAMEEAMRRMEAGEDPDQVEAELGDALEQEDPFGGTTGTTAGGLPGLKALRRALPPKRDDTWYPLQG